MVASASVRECHPKPASASAASLRVLEALLNIFGARGNKLLTAVRHAQESQRSSGTTQHMTSSSRQGWTDHGLASERGSRSFVERGELECDELPDAFVLRDGLVSQTFDERAGD